MDYTVLEIDTPKVFEIVKALDPTYKEIEYEEAHNCFLVLDFPVAGSHTVVRPEHINGFKLESMPPIKTWKMKKD
jgi:hypothetical protein